MDIKSFEELSTIIKDRKIKVYISGPISGIKNYNKEEFERVEIELSKRNLVPVNPHKLSNKEVEELVSQYENIQDEREKEIIHKKIWSLCMKIDIAELMYCHAMVVLKGWETSRGAIMEIFNAQKVGIPIFMADSYEQFSYVFEIQKLPKKGLV